MISNGCFTFPNGIPVIIFSIGRITRIILHTGSCYNKSISIHFIMIGIQVNPKIIRISNIISLYQLPAKCYLQQFRT